MKSLLICLCLLLVGLVSDTFAQESAPPATQPSLLANGDFSADSNGDGVPDHWTGKLPEGGEWVNEDGKLLLRLKQTEPGKTVLFYQRLDVKADTPKVLQLKVKARYENVKPGKSSWFDARILTNWKDEGGKGVTPQPPAVAFKGTSKGWVEKSVHFRVPERAGYLEVMPAMFQAESGQIDFAAIEVFPSSEDKLPPPPPMTPSEPMKEVGSNLPRPLKVVGNQIHDPSGNHVWLQGVSIDSLQWSAGGEGPKDTQPKGIHQSVIVAIEQWKSNVVRLPITEQYWYGHGKWQDKDKEGLKYREIVDEAVRLCSARGAYLVLDLHRFGAPSERHVTFWKDAAIRYKNHPGVLFEIYNEPHSLSWKVWRDGGQVGKDAEDKGVVENNEKIQNQTTPGMQAIIDAIRATGASNIIIAPGLDWSYNLQGILKGYALDDRGGNGIVYSSHVYPWKKNWQKNFLDVAEKYPLFIGETGNPSSWDDFKFIPEKERYEEVGINSEWPKDMIAVIQKHKLNWTAFSFHPKCAPAMLKDWSYEPNEHWGAYVKRALAGETFELKKLR